MLHCPSASPTSMTLTVETSATAGGNCKISLWDYTLSRMETVDVRPVSTADTTYSVSIPGPLGRFVGSDGKVKARIGFENPTGPRTWRGQVDRISGRVTP